MESALEAVARRGLALVQGLATSNVSKLTVFELNSIFRCATEREVNVFKVSLSSLQNLFIAANINASRQSLELAMNELHSRLRTGLSKKENLKHDSSPQKLDDISSSTVLVESENTPSSSHQTKQTQKIVTEESTSNGSESAATGRLSDDPDAPQKQQVPHSSSQSSADSLNSEAFKRKSIESKTDTPTPNHYDGRHKVLQPQISLSLVDILFFFGIICPWNSVEQLVALIIAASKASTNKTGLNAGQVIRILCIAKVPNEIISEFENNFNSRKESKKSKPLLLDEVAVEGYDELLALLHEYEVFQEHTITHAKLKREAARKFETAADMPRSSGPENTLKRLAHYEHNDNVVECLIAMHSTLSCTAVTNYLAETGFGTARDKFLPSFVDAVAMRAVRVDNDDQRPSSSLDDDITIESCLRTFFDKDYLQLLVDKKASTLRILTCVAARIHTLCFEEKNILNHGGASTLSLKPPTSSAALIRTTTLVFALLLLNEDVHSDSVSKPQKWDLNEFNSMLQPLWLEHGGTSSKIIGPCKHHAISAAEKICKNPLSKLFGKKTHSGWMCKRALLGALELYLIQQKEQRQHFILGAQTRTSEADDKVPPPSDPSVVKEVLTNFQDSEDGKRIREACSRTVGATVDLALGEMQHATADLKVLHSIYERLTRYLGQEANASEDAEVSTSEKMKQDIPASLSDDLKSIAVTAKAATAQTIANRLIFYDIDRLESEVQRLESLVGWLDEYSIDLLSRSRNSQMRYEAVASLNNTHTLKE